MFTSLKNDKNLNSKSKNLNLFSRSTELNQWNEFRWDFLV